MLLNWKEFVRVGAEATTELAAEKCAERCLAYIECYEFFVTSAGNCALGSGECIVSEGRYSRYALLINLLLLLELMF